jgi:Cu-Zn family superoxide dismutase
MQIRPARLLIAVVIAGLATPLACKRTNREPEERQRPQHETEVGLEHAKTPSGQPAAPVPDAAASQTHPETAAAVLAPTAGHDVHGSLSFERVAGGVRVHGTIEGLTPGRHGIHIHANGDCSAPDGKSAGDHFTLGAGPHGAPDAPPSARHTGDLGNLEADGSGKADYDRVDAVLALDGDASVIGRAVIVHASADDLTTQPSGNSGDRVACGVIAAH